MKNSLNLLMKIKVIFVSTYIHQTTHHYLSEYISIYIHTHTHTHRNRNPVHVIHIMKIQKVPTIKTTQNAQKYKAKTLYY